MIDKKFGLPTIPTEQKMWEQTESAQAPKEVAKVPEKTEKEKLHDRVQEMRAFVGNLRSHIDKSKNIVEIQKNKFANVYHKTVEEDCEHALEFPDDFSVQEVSTGLSHLAAVFAGEMRGIGLDGATKDTRDESNERMQKARGLFLEAMEKMIPEGRSASALQKDLEKRVKEKPNDSAAINALYNLQHLNELTVKGVIRYNVLQNSLEQCAEDLSLNAWNMIENADSLNENPDLVAESGSQGLRLEVFRLLETQREASARLLFGNAAGRIEDLKALRVLKTKAAEEQMAKK